MTTRLDRFRGALVGLAVCDALGAPVEFRERDSFPPITGYRAGGPFNLPAGYWTDDTSLALCLADSLLRSKGFSRVDQLETYCRWYKDGYLSSTGECFDIGGTTRDSLEAFMRGEPTPTGHHRAGNGSLMRLAPVPLYFFGDAISVIWHSGESSKTTHADHEPVDACRHFGNMIHNALMGYPKDKILDDQARSLLRLEPPSSSGVFGVVTGNYQHFERDGIRSSGYVVHTLEAALWSFHTTFSFEEGALLAVNLGDDSDTVGAVYGQIAGAYYGYDAIPEEWRRNLYDVDRLRLVADDLYTAAHS